MGTFLDATAAAPATPNAQSAPSSSATRAPGGGARTFLDAAKVEAPPASAPTGGGTTDGVRTFLHAAEDRAAPVVAKTGEILTRLGVPRAIDLLSRPGHAGAAFFAGDDPGDIAHAFTSGDQAQYAGDVDRVKQHLGLKHGGPEEVRYGAPVLDTDQLPPFARGVLDFGIQTITDPTTVVGGDVARGVGGAAGATARAAGRGIAKTSTGRDAIDVAHGVGNYLTFGGSAKRELGADRFHGALAADNRQASREEEAARRLHARYDAIVAPLTENEKRKIYRVQNGEEQLHDPATGNLIVPQHVADASHALRKLGMNAAALQANPSGQRFLGYNKASLANARISPLVEPWNLSYAKGAGNVDRTRGNVPEVMAMQHPDDAIRVPASGRRVTGRVDRPYVLPPDLQDFASPAEQGILGRANIRQNYLPGPREPKPVEPDARPQSFNLLRPFAPNLMQREDISVGEGDEDLAKFDEAWRSMLGNAARQGTAGRLRHEVGAPLDLNSANREPTALEQLFEVQPRARGAARTGHEKAADLAHGVLDLSKNAVTGFGLKHSVVNVPTLAALSEGPGAALEALVRGTALARKSAGARYDALRPGIEGGVITPFADRTNALVDAVSKLPVAGRPLGALARGTNALTWAIDDAAKAAVLRRKLARGMSPDAAAAETMREMIDYRHRSQATRQLGNIAPFATFRSRLPAAIASSASRNPARVLALDRATQGFATNGRVDVNQPNGDRRTPATSNPLSDVLPLGEEPQRYARATLADPLRVLLSPIAMKTRDFKREDGQTHEHLQPNYFTYGEPLMPHRGKDGRQRAGFLASQAASYLPFGLGDALLKATGTNELPAEDWVSTLLGGVLGVHVR